MNQNEMIKLDLPSLQSIQLGSRALVGDDEDESCSLTIRSNKEMFKMIECRSSKSDKN